MLVIGIDPGTATTGYGLVRQNAQGELITIYFGVIKTSSKSLMTDRLLQLHRELSAVISLHRPETAAVEELFFQRNVATAMSVGQARGIALLALAQAGIPVDEYAPSEIKQAISGYGGADKQQMQQMVRTILALDAIPRPDDAADALAVAICHLHSSQIRRKMEGSS
jgi:crossover junction endodeoxyribonuclease RuvC